MKRMLLAAGSLCLMLASAPEAGAAPSVVEHARQCIALDDWAGSVHDGSSGVAITVLADMAGTAAKQVVDRINAEPPQTHLAADRVVVVGARSLATDLPAPYVLVAFFDHGCLVASGKADAAGIAGLLEGESI